ncbi:hypothetical protein CIG75_10335 [Tumebacillus algifaecis]|uniref:Uncharacterized protein n=1 Tax=Tumebacillus algifaecis TaxID=1214604 RepID=A0A223D158_9BACL|nr:endospore germination permease [Tumebacillus algifaecis]ASS75350.1 hypothetical protein CIG75_10335 [Tumebacillus algifaecis]
MSRSQGEINVLQASMILISFVGINLHVMVTPVLLRSAGRDAWLSVLVSGALLMLWIPCLYLIMKKSGQQHLLQWVKQKAGPLLSIPLTFIFLIQMFVIAYSTIQDTTTWLALMYLYLTPKPVLVVIFTLLCAYPAFLGLRVIAITNGLLLPFVILFGFFVMFANIPNKHYDLLFPMLEHGITPVMKGMIPAASGLSELAILLLLQHHLKKKAKKGRLFLLAGYSVILMLGPLTGAIAEFGPDEGGTLRYPASEEWRIVSLSRIFEHVDFLSVFQWMVGSFVRTALAIYLIPEILQISGRKQRLLTISIVVAILIVVLLLPFEDAQYLSLITNFLLPYNLWFVIVLTLVLLFLCFLKRPNEGGESYQ